MDKHEASRRRSVGVLFVLGSALCFSTMGTVVKDAYDHGASATGLLGIRMLVASVIWVAVLNRRLGAIDWRSMPVRRLALASMLGVGVASLAEYAAYRYLPVALVVVILFMAPAWVAVGQWFLTRRSMGVGGVAGVVLLLGGLAFLNELTLSGISPLGVVLTLIASLGIATFFTVAGHSLAQLRPVSGAAVVAIAASLIAVPIALVDGTFFSSLTSPQIALRGALLAVVATVISLVFLLNGVRRLGAFPASVVSAIEPVFAGFLAWWLLDEVLSTLQMLGAALVIGGTIVVEATRKAVHEEIPVAVGR